MYLDRPHVRHDGVYVSRNTYLKTGIVEWTVKNPVALVCYYRYYRSAAAEHQTSSAQPAAMQVQGMLLGHTGKWRTCQAAFSSEDLCLLGGGLRPSGKPNLLQVRAASMADLCCYDMAELSAKLAACDVGCCFPHSCFLILT